MSKIHYSEKFFSYQCEGRFVGVPSVFLRTFGCNFRCKSFGCSTPITGTHNPEVVEIIKNIDQYQNFDQLPLVQTGCDSYPSVYPEFRRFAQQSTVAELDQELRSLLPQGRWYLPNGNDVHLVITGGEPLLGWQRSYPELLNLQMNHGLRNVTFETNGTQTIQSELGNWINDPFTRENLAVTFSVSPKLSASGEAWTDAIKPNVIAEYQAFGFVYLKFVVDRPEHFDEADRALAEYRAAGFEGPAYVMPVGGVVSVYEGNKYNIADEALKRGYYFSPRLQIDIWQNGWGK